MNGIKHSKTRWKNAVLLLQQGFGQYKLQIATLVVLGFFSGLLEVIGINAIIPLFSIVAEDSGQSVDFVSRAIRGLFDFLHLPFSLKYLMGFIIGMFILKSLSMILFNYIQTKIIADYELRTRDALYRQTVGARWPFLLKQKSGYLETILLKEIGENTYLLKYISQVILLATSLVMYTFVALNLSPAITLSAFAVGGVLFLFMKKYVYKTRKISEKLASLHREINHFISQHVLGMKTVKAMNMENPVLERGSDYFTSLKNLRIQNFFLQNTTTELIRPIGMIFIVLAFAYVYKSPDFNIASFAVIIYMIEKIFAYLQNAQMKLHSVNEFVPYLKNVVAYQNATRAEMEKDPGQKNFSFTRSLDIRALQFSYDQEPVLNNVSFVLRKGEMTGLIGPSGAGKTTLVDILLRLLSASAGEMLLDGENVQNISLASWRKNIGYVSQDIFLLNDTIGNNIRFYDQTLSIAQIENAAKLANIYEFIASQPQGLDTPVGERGLELSAGQRQRVILARVLARDPQLLILDEATSALDNESEVAIQKSIEGLRGKTTVLVIAHRLSTIINVDNLLVLENGKITEQGAPQTLLKNEKSYFYKVYNIRENVQ